MDAWSTGLVVLVVVGLGLIVFGALWDRARNRRRAAEMLAAPSRAIPSFRPDAPAPHYLSDLQARRPPAGAPRRELDEDERAELRARVAGADLTIGSGYASTDFVTDAATGWAVLDGPAVLVCADPVASIRELLGVLEPTVLSGTPLVVLAPGLAPEVLGTLEVNHIQRRLTLVAVVCADEGERDRVGRACGAQPVDRADRQAGYLPPAVLGRCGRWVSTARTSHVLDAR